MRTVIVGVVPETAVTLSQNETALPLWFVNVTPVPDAVRADDVSTAKLMLFRALSHVVPLKFRAAAPIWVIVGFAKPSAEAAAVG